MMNNSIVLGVDIGGSHITSALVNLKTKEVLADSHFREQVNAKETADHIISKWTNVIQRSFAACPVVDKKIGIAMPGPFDYQNGVALMKDQEKFDELYGMNIKNILAGKLGTDGDNVRFMNDAECFLRGEAFGGAARNFNKAIGLTLGTGLGSAVYEHGVTRDADLWCSPFKDSIAEDYISTRWFTKRYQQLTGKPAKDVKELVDQSNDNLVLKQIFAEFGKSLALFLNDFVQKKRPEVVVIGGNIARAYDLFEEALQENVAKHSVTVRICKAQLGEEALLIGAASCWYKAEPEILEA